MNRRAFLFIGAFGSVAMTTPLSAIIDSYSDIPDKYIDEILSGYPHYKVICERSFKQAIEFTEKAERYGLSTVIIDRDVTDLWYSDLRDKWKSERTWLAGITSPQSLFLLAQMAKDEKHNIVQHRILNTDMSLWVIGPRS